MLHFLKVNNTQYYIHFFEVYYFAFLRKFLRRMGISIRGCQTVLSNWLGQGYQGDKDRYSRAWWCRLVDEELYNRLQCGRGNFSIIWQGRSICKQLSLLEWQHSHLFLQVMQLSRSERKWFFHKKKHARTFILLSTLLDVGFVNRCYTYIGGSWKAVRFIGLSKQPAIP